MPERQAEGPGRSFTLWRETKGQKGRGVAPKKQCCKMRVHAKMEDNSRAQETQSAGCGRDPDEKDNRHVDRHWPTRERGRSREAAD